MSKYNGSQVSLSTASVLEQWCYWIKHSHEHTEEELGALLPGLEFLRATRQLTEINQVTVEKHMYDSREKAALNFESGLIDARQEGLEEGEIKGEIKLIRTLQEILGVPLSDEADMQSQSLEQLQKKTADLRSQLRNRYSCNRDKDSIVVSSLKIALTIFIDPSVLKRPVTRLPSLISLTSISS